MTAMGHGQCRVPWEVEEVRIVQKSRPCTTHAMQLFRLLGGLQAILQGKESKNAWVV